MKICGVVVRGDGWGRKIGFPTANIIADENAMLPELGIYAGWVVICNDSESRGSCLARLPPGDGIPRSDSWRMRGAGGPRGTPQASHPRSLGVFPTAIHIGPRPTMGDMTHSLEVHILDFDDDLYGKMLCVEIVKFLRGVEKFDTIDELRHAIANDCTRTREILQL